MRIVSLIASATEILHHLNLSDHQVGRSHECDYPPGIRALPVCTAPSIAVDGSSAEIDRLVKERLRSALSVYEVYTEVLDRLRPTHILTQTQCRVCAVSLEDVEKALCQTVASSPRVVALEPNSLADIWEDIRRVADACDASDRGRALTGRLQTDMAAMSRLAATVPGPAPRVACLEWLEPLMSAGNWIPELIAMANGENLFGEAGRHSPYLQWADLAAADPDAVVIAACGFDIDRTRREMYWLEQRPEWNRMQAVRSGRVFITDGNQYMTRPGPRVADSLQILCEVLHPGTFQPLLEGAGWVRAVR